jgi:hypothetical protein
VINPNKKTDIGVHPATIILIDDNHWMRIRYYKFKIIINLAKVDEKGVESALMKKVGESFKLKLKKETLSQNGELIVKIKGD